VKTIFIVFFVINVTAVFPQTGWIQQTSGTNENLNAVSCIDMNVATVVGDNGTILRTTDGGTSWQQQPSGLPNSLRGVSFIDANHGIAVGDGGSILRTTDGGTNWQIATSNTTNILDDVIFIDPTTSVAVGWTGTILRSSDSGITCSRRTAILLKGLWVSTSAMLTQVLRSDGMGRYFEQRTAE
jgi:photosystem II stability/assembly factor-like uncharacterized protein